MRTNRTPVKRHSGPPTREELEALQRARVARIEENSKVPWIRYALSAIMGLLTIVIMGGGILSLIMAAGVIAIVSRGRISYRKSPLDR